MTGIKECLGANILKAVKKRQGVDLTCLKPLTETQFQEQIIDLAHVYHWTVAHFRPARVIKNGKTTWRTAVSADGAGFPDLIMLRPPRVVIAEIKSENGELTLHQQGWANLFQVCPKVEYYLWKPSDIDAVIEILKLGTPL